MAAVRNIDWAWNRCALILVITGVFPSGVGRHRRPSGGTVAGEEREGPVADFCVGLGQLQQGSGLKRAALARRMGYSRSQLSEILSGRIRRPPEWDRLVEPLVRACTGDDQRAVAEWRRRHDVLVAVHSELTRQDRQGGSPPILSLIHISEPTRPY